MASPPKDGCRIGTHQNTNIEYLLGYWLYVLIFKELI